MNGSEGVAEQEVEGTKPVAAVGGSDQARLLFHQLGRLYRKAGDPSLRDIARSEACKGKITHTTVSAVLRGPKLPKWDKLVLVVTALGGDIAFFKDLWVAARDAEDVEDVPSADAIDHDEVADVNTIDSLLSYPRDFSPVPKLDQSQIMDWHDRRAQEVTQVLALAHAFRVLAATKILQGLPVPQKDDVRNALITAVDAVTPDELHWRLTFGWRTSIFNCQSRHKVLPGPKVTLSLDGDHGGYFMHTECAVIDPSGHPAIARTQKKNNFTSEAVFPDHFQVVTSPLVPGIYRVLWLNTGVVDSVEDIDDLTPEVMSTDQFSIE
jgi:hypothetical protein